MKTIYVRKVIDDDGSEVIELDLNKPWKAESMRGYQNPIEQVNHIGERSSKKSKKEFIKILN